MIEKTKVLLLRSRATDPTIRKIAESLHSYGYNVTLLLWNRREKFIDDSKIKYKIKYFNFKAPQDTISGIFFFPIWWIYSFLYIIHNKPDIVHSCDFDTEYPAIIGKFFTKSKLIYSIYDFYANNLSDGSFNQIREKIRKLISFIEKFGIQFSDLLILSDESRYEEIRGSQIKSIIYIYNSCVDIYNLAPKKYPNIKKDFIIFYAGLLSYIRGIGDIIKCVNDISGVKLILAGPIIDKEILVGNLNTNISYIGWIPTYEELLQITLNSDLLFRFSDPSHPKTKYESPNKLFEAMMCGKPIIVSDNSTMANIVKEEKCGFVVEYGDQNNICKNIETLKNNREIYKKLGNNGRMAYENKYSWTIMQNRLINGYKNLYQNN